MQKSGFKYDQIAAYAIFLCLFALSGCGGNANKTTNTADPSGGDSPAKRGEQIVAEFLKRDAPRLKGAGRFTIKTEG